MDYYLTGYFEYEEWSRSVPLLRQASWREDTNEMTFGTRLRRMLTDTLGGAIGYSYSEKDGSDFLLNGFGVNRIDPIHWGDRTRHKFTVSGDWAPLDQFSVQARVDGTSDTYDGLPNGRRDGSSLNAAIDAFYALTSNWSLTAFVSRNEIFRDQATFDGSQFWSSELTNLSYTGGIGVHGNVRESLKVGVDLQYSNDKSKSDLAAVTGPEVTDLPGIEYQQFDFNAFSEYVFSETSSFRFQYGFMHITNDDWTYDEWQYADGTVIAIPDEESAHLVGLSYAHRW